MVVSRVKDLSGLESLREGEVKLVVVERQPLPGIEGLFKGFIKQTFKVAGAVNRKNARADIEHILIKVISPESMKSPLAQAWLDDMANICTKFCELQKNDAICFWLGTQRGCRRYHIDMVPQRLLVTYYGQGTEWLPDEAANKKAFFDGMPNEEIIKDKASIQHIQPWEIAIFKGGNNGLLHRTPDSALTQSTLLMRLDDISFLSNLQLN